MEEEESLGKVISELNNCTENLGEMLKKLPPQQVFERLQQTFGKVNAKLEEKIKRASPEEIKEIVKEVIENTKDVQILELVEWVFLREKLELDAQGKKDDRIEAIKYAISRLQETMYFILHP